MKFIKTRLTRQLQEGNAYQLRNRRKQSNQTASNDKRNNACA